MASKSALHITVLTHDARWARLRPAMREVIGMVLARQKIMQGELTLVLTNDGEIKTLNHTYRKKNKPTNVLSFENGETVNGVRHFGDVVMSYDTLKAEAFDQKKTLKNHASHLAIHGILHLLGFDHETDRQAKTMEALEISLLASMGIANPYEAR